eukprot:TRINITY_DN11014_c0_g1_i1.p1 TRINITY_DN11014_c0_g1~~TRINITY_DN11014_c0_g1_i1.p1  ORF type:complete len:805 (-),score=195.80 TRINITY_DN11014_c0_g1_i1:47-2461(-)
MNSAGLTVSHTSVAINAQNDVKTEHELDEKMQTLTLKLGKELNQGDKIQVRVQFSGILSDSLTGFYRSKYEINGEKRYMAVTQFEASDARRCFPCWDEPAAKATFTVSLTVPLEKTALSNMDVVKTTTLPSGEKRVEFDKTPVMSTYLLALAVGDFDFIQSTTKTGVKVRIYTPPGLAPQGQFALDMGVWSLDFFNDFFKIPYPLPKSDFLAVPDFSFGAMENWGLITFRTTALLVNEKTTTPALQYVAYVVAHELTHQWFGNLVTMNWWNDLWLNEGFATFLGFYLAHKRFPEWDQWTKFSLQKTGNAMEIDSLESSHPIEVEVNNPEQIGEIFDAISYSKGATVIRMIFERIGESAFKEGITNYLTEFSYKNTVTDDLWNAWSKSSGIDVKSFMSAWTQKMGFPVIDVSSKGDVLELTQERFLISGEIDQSKQLWWVPLKAKCGDDKYQLGKGSFCEKTTSIPNTSSWLKLNSDQCGMCIIKYPNEMLQRLKEPVQKLLLSTLDRLEIILDSSFLCKSGKMKTSEFLELAKWYSSEPNYFVWEALSGRLGEIASLFSNEAQILSVINKMRVQLARPTVAKLGWEKKEHEDYSTQNVRNLALGMALAGGDTETVEEAKRRFDLYIKTKDDSVLSQDMRSRVLISVVKHGDIEEVEKVKSLFLGTTNLEIRNEALIALGRCKNKEKLQEICNWVLRSGEVRSQDFCKFIISLSANDADFTWKWFTSEWGWFMKTFESSLNMISTAVEYSISSLCGAAALDDVASFFASHPTPAAATTIKQGLESIRTRTRWLNASLHDMADWAK